MVTREREAAHDLAILTFLPTLKATASYTRNQSASQATFPDGQGGTNVVTITPQDQLDATLRADATILDVGAIRRVEAASLRTTAARFDEETAERGSERDIVTAYWDRVASEGMERAAEKALASAVENEKVVSSRAEAKLDSALDQDRAEASIERQKQSLAEARRTRAVASRKLVSLTGLSADGAAPLDQGAFAGPAPLLPSRSSLEIPAVRASEAELRASEVTAQSTWLGLVPRLSGFAQERFTNAVGFGTSPIWSLGVSAEWKLDATVIGNARVDSAARDTARVRVEKAKQEAWDEVQDDYQQVIAKREALVAADREAKASRHGLEVANARFAAGTGTELEVTLAERDSFQADIASVQARAELELAQALLDLAKAPARSRESNVEGRRR